MKSLVTTTLLLIAALCSGQSTVKGRLINQNKEGLEFASVLLFSAKDSSLTKAGYTEENGNFLLEFSKPGKYFLKTTYLSYNDYSSEVFEIQENEVKNIPDIILTETATSLSEVEVKTMRPLVEVKADKTVFNVEGTINATGQDGFELLRKAPGVVIDNNNRISVKGKSGVQVFIDGKPAPFAGEDLVNYLKNLQSAQISAIDIITNPSSKYEAAGTAGIIDIKLKKAQNIGGNGSIYLGVNQGFYAKYNAGASGNYRTKDFNVYGSYGYNDAQRKSYQNFDRLQSGKFYNQKNTVISDSKSHNYKGGFDYYMTSHNTIGVQLNGSSSDGVWGPNGYSVIGPIDGAVDQVLRSHGENPNEFKNNNYNFNYRFDNAKGNTINFDADYGKYKAKASNQLANAYYNADETELQYVNENRNNSSTDIEIYSFKADYENNLWGGKLGFGGKIASVVTDNDFKFYDVKDGQPIINEDRTNRFTYDEKINAAYLNYSKQLTKVFSYQVGVRMENTHSIGKLNGLKPINEKDKLVDRNYTDLFPSAGISYQLNEKNSFGLTYSRRIDRPDYQSLNPFENKLDELTYQKGNSFLRPQYSHSFELSHSYMGFLNTSLNYTHTDDLFAQIIQPVNDSASVLQAENVDTQDNFGLSISASFPVKKWWSIYLSLSGNYTSNKADLGDNNKVNLEVVMGNIYMQQTFMLPKSFSIELSGWFNTPGIWEGNFKTNAMGSLDLGVQKKILKGKGNIRLSLTDLFNTANWSGSTRINDFVMFANGGWESQQIRLNFSYSFGNQKSKTKLRTTGMEDEAKRIQKSGN